MATPLRRPVDPPEVFDRLKTEAKEDALKIKQFLHPNLKGAPIWEMGKRVEQGKNATWDIIAKWAAKSPDAGYQGRGGPTPRRPTPGRWPARPSSCSSG